MEQVVVVVVVTPGEVVGKATQVRVGRGAYVAPHNNLVYASLTGLRRTLSPPSNSPDQRPTVEVTGHKAHGAIPQPGSLVIARVTRVTTRMASADIMQQDVRATEIDKVDMHLSYRPGDVVKALVVSFLFDWPLY
ncbi:exosome complex component CSL4-like isoform X2 [Fagus crenata]